MGLTDKGHRDAVTLGRSLAAYARMRLFHSPALRCEQTAVDIAQGARGAGIRVISVEPRDVLGISYILDRTRAIARMYRLGEAFARTWFSGQLEAGLAKPPEASLREHLAFVREVLDEPSDASRIDLLVTHDLNVILLREMLLGITQEEAGVPAFLDGLLFRRDPDGLRARYRGTVRLLDDARGR